jgi:polysaccharide biosynthesis protein PslH
MRILMIADYLPYPLIGGDRIRIYNLLRRVASRHEVSLAAFLESPEDEEGVSHLRQFCVRVETANFMQRSRSAKASDMLRYALGGKPPELALLYSQELTGKIKNIVSAASFDIVQIEHSRMGLYLETLPRDSRHKSVLMLHNFTPQQHRRASHIEQRWDRKLRTWINSIAMGYWEPHYAGKFDRCATVSEADRLLLMKANPRLQVDVIPNGVDVDKYQPLPLPTESASHSLLFIGNMGYSPCADAVLYFCREIFPFIRQVKDVEFWVVGRDPGPEVLELDGGGVHVSGRVEDVVPYYQKSTICIVPLRAGGGTRLKILEAMALGRPVVSTTIGCEGLDVVDGVHLLIADTPEQFVEKTLRLINDRQLYQYISANSRQLVETRYSWDGIAERLMNVYESMVL